MKKFALKYEYKFDRLLYIEWLQLKLEKIKKKNLISSLDFNRAYKRLKVDLNNNFFPDIVNYKDFSKWIEPEIINKCKDLITLKQCYSSIIPKDIPKKNFLMRPTIVISFIDMLIYQAIIDLLADNVDNKMCSKCYSFCMNDSKNKHLFKNLVRWKSFQNKIKENCDSNEFQYVIETDLANYFEHIHHKKLTKLIKEVFQTKIDCIDEICSYLSSFLKNYSLVSFTGVPQGYVPSSFLGDLFLSQVDEIMIRKKFEYIRYVDDIRIFCKSYNEAKLTLYELIKELRKEGLFLNSAKTKIIKREKSKLKLDSELAKMDEIDISFNTNNYEDIKSCLPKLSELFYSCFCPDNEFNDRHFRFCVNKFKRLRTSFPDDNYFNDYEDIINKILKSFEEKPFCMDYFFQFLSLFPDNKNIQDYCVNFLNSQSNIYSWQEMWILHLLLTLNIINDDIKQKVMESANTIFQDYNKDDCSRARTALIIGKYGDNVDRRQLRDKFIHENTNIVKRAILLAIQELSKDERNEFYSQVLKSNLDLDLKYILYFIINNLENPLYYIKKQIEYNTNIDILMPIEEKNDLNSADSSNGIEIIEEADTHSY